MTPKEEAKQIVDKFLTVTYGHGEYGSGVTRAKECAIIYVDGLIEEIEKLHKPEYVAFIIDQENQMDGYERIEHWNEVKKEIQAL